MPGIPHENENHKDISSPTVEMVTYLFIWIIFLFHHLNGL
jgi:hypothetical protein